MRSGIQVAPAGATLSGADLAVLDVRTDWWREFWLVSKLTGPGAWSLDVYATEEHARAETHRLASGTHAATGSAGADVVMTADVGEAFDPTPMTVRVRADGTTPDTLFAWTHNPAGLLVERIAALLRKYADPNEMFDGFGVIVGHQLPVALLQAVGVTAGSYSLEDHVQQYQQGVVQIELHAWVSRLENETAYKECLKAGSGLVAFAEEQRTMGGLAIESSVLTGAQIGIETVEGGGLVYHAIVPLRVQFADMVGTRQAGTDEYGTGGVYAASLN